jgi:MoxR-like ATPase
MFLVDLQDGAHIPLPERGGMPPSVHVIQQEAIDALRAALVTGRPLLVRGEPGTGKSQLARAAAEALGRAFVPHAVDSRTETRDLLWSIAIIEFVQPGPLWWAFDWPSAEAQARRSGASAPLTPEGWHPDRGAVVLIDEIDKADPAVPNGLLDALGHGRFDVPGGAPVAMNRAIRPLVAITTNEERALPDAFLRRCLVLHLSLPAERAALVATLMTRGRAHFPACPAAVLEQAADLLAADREEIRDRGLAPPGLAEYIDLLHAVLELGKTEDEQLGLLRRIAPLALRKHPPEPMQ